MLVVTSSIECAKEGSYRTLEFKVLNNIVKVFNAIVVVAFKPLLNLIQHLIINQTGPPFSSLASPTVLFLLKPFGSYRLRKFKIFGSPFLRLPSILYQSFEASFFGSLMLNSTSFGNAGHCSVDL
jgi:hypothetical protein